MATIEQLHSALISADKAGDVEAAKALAGEIRRMRASTSAGEPAKPTAKAQQEAGNGAADVVSGLESVSRGMSLGWMDKARAAADALVAPVVDPATYAGTDFSGRYAEKLAAERKIADDFRDRRPVVATGAELAGGLLTTGGLMTPRAAGAIPAALHSAKQGAIVGGVSGAGASAPGEELSGAGRGAAIGGALGAALPAVTSTVGRVVDKKAAELAARKAANAIKGATLSEAQKVGYVATPSQADAGVVSRMLGGLSGKAKTEQLASIRNQAVTDSLARKALGLPANAPLTPETLRMVRQQAYQAGYQPIAQAGPMQTDAVFSKALDDVVQKFQGPARSFPGAARDDVAEMVKGYRVQGFDSGDAVGAVQLLRDAASDAYRAGNGALGKAHRAVADAIEDQLERNLMKAGKQGAELLKTFRDARQLMAKSHTVEKALVEGSGNVDAIKLAQQLARKKPLSGELETAARFGQAFGDVARVPKSGWSNPLTVVDYGYGAAGAGLVDPLMAALPAARVASRYAILSPAYQRAFVKPQYGGRMVNQLAQLTQEQRQGLINALAGAQAYEAGAMTGR